jgi:hypothetical protein
MAMDGMLMMLSLNVWQDGEGKKTEACKTARKKVAR